MTTIDEGEMIPPHVRITGEKRVEIAGEIVELYRRGMPIRNIAKMYGRSYGFIHRVLSEAGEELRPRGGNTRSAANKKLSSDEQAEYRERLQVLNRKRR